MFGIGSTEFVLIALFVLLIFGPDKLPQLARTIGRFTKDFKRYQDMMETTIRAEMYNLDAGKADETAEGASSETGTLSTGAAATSATDEDDEEEEEE